jgi:hypothetical protein
MDLQKIAEAFARKEVDSMSLDEMRSAAIDSRLSELHNCAGGIDSLLLLDSLLQDNDGDTDRMREFMVANGANDSDAEKMIAEFMQ